VAGNDSLLSRTSEILAGVLLALALVGIQVLIGGTRLVYSLPIYALLGLAGILATMRLGAGSATVGGGVLFITVAAVVIGGTSLAGGRGGVLRTMLGVIMLTVLNNGLILSGVSSSVQSGVSGIILIGAIIVAAWPLRSRLRITK